MTGDARAAIRIAMHESRLYSIFVALLLVTSCADTTTERLGLPPLETVPSVDVSRYLGTWHEIASFPQSFQKGCTATTATYTLAEKPGEIVVENRCNKGTVGGPEEIATGRARVVDASTNAKLEVSFFGPFWGAYWVIDLGDDYEFAVVGHPGRDYLWVLSRTPTMDPAVYEGILLRLRAKGYETERLVLTQQR